MKENTKGSGWHEDKKPVSTEKGIKNVALRHREVAVKERLKDTLREPMAEPDLEVPLLPEVSNEKAETDELVKFNFAVPSSKIKWLENYAEENGLEVKIEGNTGHAQLLESHVDLFLRAINTFEEEFENEMQNKNPDEEI